MRKNILVICILGAALALQSFNTSRSISLGNTEQIIDYMNKHELESISKSELYELSNNTPAPEGNYDEYCTTCSEITYCGMDSADLIQYIDNYRDSVWSKTSPYFNGNPYTEDVLFTGGASLNEFDARFMDMDIAKLENYICAIKNSEIANDVNTIRFYYIRYNQNNAPFANYEWKHSIAMVPAKVNQNGLTEAEYVQQLVRQDGTYFSLSVDVNNLCSNTAVANHSLLCPPFTGCQDNTLLQIADTN